MGARFQAEKNKRFAAEKASQDLQICLTRKNKMLRACELELAAAKLAAVPGVPHPDIDRVRKQREAYKVQRDAFEVQFSAEKRKLVNIKKLLAQETHSKRNAIRELAAINKRLEAKKASVLAKR